MSLIKLNLVDCGVFEMLNRIIGIVEIVVVNK